MTINPAAVPAARTTQYWEIVMSWKSPKIVEIALGAEINSYACAEAKKSVARKLPLRQLPRHYCPQRRLASACAR